MQKKNKQGIFNYKRKELYSLHTNKHEIIEKSSKTGEDEEIVKAT